MDVHRARFVPHPTSAITCVAFSRPNDSGHTSKLALKLAIGRASGAIELWNPNDGNWFQEAVFPGSGKSVDGLAWTQEPDEIDHNGSAVLGQYRLFSIASSPEVTEWNLATGSVKRKSTGNFSEVWCFAVQPRLVTPKKASEDLERSTQEIVVGCGDGAIAVLTTADNDLQFKRFLARSSGKKARCMCITYQNQNVVVAGFADSMIRVYDARTGHQTRTMSLGVGLPNAPKNVLVWQVKCLPNSDIVSADSNGEIRIWDHKTWSLTQRIKGHNTDCLDFVTSTDGETIFSGSIDGKISVYKRSTVKKLRGHWAKTSGRSTHHGEVKAMASFDSKSLSVVVLGGSGVGPMVLPLRDYGKAYPRSLPNLPQGSPVVSAPEARLVVSWWKEEISIWRIRDHPDTPNVDEKEQPKKLIATMALNSRYPIRSVSISRDGSLLAAATEDEIKFFQLGKHANSHALKIKRIALPTEFAKLGANFVQISPDSKWVATVTTESEIHIARILLAGSEAKTVKVLAETSELERMKRIKPQHTAFGSYDQTVTHLSFSADSHCVAVTDRRGYIDSWLLNGEENPTAPASQRLEASNASPSSDEDDDSDDSSSDDDDDEETVSYFGQHWADNAANHLLPKLEASPLVFSFRPTASKATPQNGPSNEADHILFVITARHAIHELDIDHGCLTDWSRLNPASALPVEVKNIKDRAMGAVWDITSDRERVWIYGTSWVLMVNLAPRVLAEKHLNPNEGSTRKRRISRSDDDSQGEPRSSKKTRVKSAAGGRQRMHDLDVLEIEDETRPEEDADEDVDMIDDVPIRISDVNAAESSLVPLSPPKSPAMAVDEEDEPHAITEVREPFTWYTFEYRPILGMVPLTPNSSSSTTKANGLSSKPLEVVIVERPVWETTG